jgi:hypothetical protein
MVRRGGSRSFAAQHRRGRRLDGAREAAHQRTTARDAELMPEDVPEAVRRDGLLTPLLVAAVFALSIAVAVLWSPTAGQWMWLLVLPAGRVSALLDTLDN